MGDFLQVSSPGLQCTSLHYLLSLKKNKNPSPTYKDVLGELMLAVRYTDMKVQKNSLLGNISPEHHIN